MIDSGTTPERERRIAAHPSVKPQAFLRHIVRAMLPLGSGVILDPFCGAGTTLAACEALGIEGVGVEIDPEYYRLATSAIPDLALI